MHDLLHHKAVWKNCGMIVRGEGLIVDMDVLKLSAFWHDVIIDKVGRKSCDEVKRVCYYLEESLDKYGFDKEFVENTIKTIKHHEF